MNRRSEGVSARGQPKKSVGEGDPGPPSPAVFLADLRWTASYVKLPGYELAAEQEPCADEKSVLSTETEVGLSLPGLPGRPRVGQPGDGTLFFEAGACVPLR